MKSDRLCCGDDRQHMLPRSSYYFKPKGESLFNLQVMNAIDRKFLDCPFYGVEYHTTQILDNCKTMNLKKT